jgi:hypothetical protein
MKACARTLFPDHDCPCAAVDAKICSGNKYVVVPVNCKVLVNAEHGPLKIILPPFTDNASSQIIKIKRIDKSDNKVEVVSATFSKKLDRHNFSI